MKPFVEQRMYTTTEQVVIVQPNETRDGIVVGIQESEDKYPHSRLYLTYDEAIELSNMLISMVDKIKKNSL